MTVETPARATVVWVVLMAATCLTWWLGTGHAGHPGAPWEVLSLIAVGCLKIHVVGYEFMELRGSPRALRGLFTVWVVALGAVTAAFAVM
jgi:hypothetical protein